MSRSVSSSSRQWPRPSPMPPDSPFPRAPPLQVARIEMLGLQRVQREGDGAESPAFVVEGVDAHRPVLVGVVDDADEALLDGIGREHQRDAVPVLAGLRHAGGSFVDVDQVDRQQNARSAALAVRSAHHQVIRRLGLEVVGHVRCGTDLSAGRHDVEGIRIRPRKAVSERVAVTVGRGHRQADVLTGTGVLRQRSRSGLAFAEHRHCIPGRFRRRGVGSSHGSQVMAVHQPVERRDAVVQRRSRRRPGVTVRSGGGAGGRKRRVGRSPVDGDLDPVPRDLGVPDVPGPGPGKVERRHGPGQVHLRRADRCRGDDRRGGWPGDQLRHLHLDPRAVGPARIENRVWPAQLLRIARSEPVLRSTDSSARKGSVQVQIEASIDTKLLGEVEVEPCPVGNRRRVSQRPDQGNGVVGSIQGERRIRKTAAPGTPAVARVPPVADIAPAAVHRHRSRPDIDFLGALGRCGAMTAECGAGEEKSSAPRYRQAGTQPAGTPTRRGTAQSRRHCPDEASTHGTKKEKPRDSRRPCRRREARDCNDRSASFQGDAAERTDWFHVSSLVVAVVGGATAQRARISSILRAGLGESEE